MDPRNPVHRTDDELRDILDEPGTWVIHGHGDRVFGVGGSLRRALDRAAGFARSGAVVVAVARVPPTRIFIFHDQIVRLIDAVRQEDLAVPADADLVDT
jgi:hypothetical protein